MNEHYLKITDKASIAEPLEIGYEYAFAGIITVDSINKKDDHKGGFEYTHKAQFTDHIELQRLGKIIKAKDTKKNSQRFRGAVWHLQQNEGMTHVDEEIFYNQMTAIAIEHLTELFTKYYKK